MSIEKPNINNSESNIFTIEQPINIKKLEEWKNENGAMAGYAHFDRKIGMKSAWGYISNPSNVKSHGFYPFITYNQVFYKVAKNSDGVTVKDKVRPICYCAHIDRCIYKYYSYMLNEHYNKYAVKQEISNSAVAYRTNLGKNNIHIAKQAFDFIRKDDCYIIVGDFKGFFDNLDHKYLKEMLLKVLDIESLPADWYAVYKNITKYSTWDLTDLLMLNRLITPEEIVEKEEAHQQALAGSTYRARQLIKSFDGRIKDLNGFNIADRKERMKKTVLSKEQFKKYKKDYIESNLDDFGIPQGSAISAAFSNVYMIEFDKSLVDYVKEAKGLYLRYSDDFIVVIPKKVGLTFKEILDFINGVVGKTEKLILEPNKTKMYSYSDSTVYDVTDQQNNKKSYIDYLGFVFDGQVVSLREKTVSKYYYRMYKKLRNATKNGGVTKKGNKVSYNQLYRTYTQKGRNGVYDKSLLPKKVLMKPKGNFYGNGNFFTYVGRAESVFGKDEAIRCSTKNHLVKIRRVRDELGEI